MLQPVGVGHKSLADYTHLVGRTLVEEIREVHKTGRPILVGTVSIEKSEYISNKLNRYGIDGQSFRTPGRT